MKNIARSFHSRVLAKSRTAHSSLMLSDIDIRFASDCERMRVDRNGSVLSVLLITLASEHQEEKDVALLERVLEGRLRVTDTAGQLNDNRIVVLLPDTSAEGAWKVATDISEVYPPGAERPECEVITYPENSHRRGKNLNRDAQDEVPEFEDPHGASQFFFTAATPLWKRFLDIFGSLVGLVVVAPIIGLSAVAVKLTSPGAAFFCQEREGLGGKLFWIWKLRTMVDGADELKEQYREFSQQDGPAFKMVKDPRTTRLGKFLRLTSIDELPQLWNVLKGDMSLVGPRPLPTDESQACLNWQRRRLSVAPGMTCTWQVFARGDVTFEEWARMDLRYAERVSLWNDLKLIFLTLPSMLLQKGMR